VRSDLQQIQEQVCKMKHKKTTKISKKQKEDLQKGFEESLSINRKQWNMII
jgi:hypothetical protein